MSDEVCPTSLGDLEFLRGLVDGAYASDLIWLSLALSLLVSLNVLTGLLDITSNIKGISGSFGNGQAIVEGNATWDSTKTAIIC
ncbi:hypothetical protein EYC80_007696 [Monilinia laxa]|uniref:Uncharacterized protein n=1 Tax=Monilinia laxa TaxID=61186 RepID=A0A5N6JWQ8_MONLA|nr:hypothetical protein EYC80_007696 [Monilinia laxa]